MISLDFTLEKSKLNFFYVQHNLFRQGWRSDSNRRITERLLAEVKSINPDFKSHEIRGKLHTFSLFNSLCKTTSVEVFTCGEVLCGPR